MKPAFADLPRTDEGMVIWGDPNTPGCPYCGEVDVKISRYNDAVAYHPATLCCEPRLKEQINLRKDELAALDRAREARRHAIHVIEDENPRNPDAARGPWRAFELWDAATREREKEVMEDLRDAQSRLASLGRLPYKDQE